MGLIADRDHAVRLARAILADLRLYNEETIVAGRLDPSVVDEGRELYRTRVAPDLYGEFDRELAEFSAKNGITSVATRPFEAVAPVPTRGTSRADRYESTRLEAENRGAPPVAILVGVLFLLVAFGAAAALLFLR